MAQRILVVEDGEDNRRIMNDLLVAAGYEVVHATNGDEGLVLAKAERPALILMDIKLPGMDGLEATRLIKADPALRATPVFAVTSYAMSDDNAKALEAGCDAYFSKPVSPRKLLAKIRETLT